MGNRRTLALWAILGLLSSGCRTDVEVFYPPAAGGESPALFAKVSYPGRGAFLVEPQPEGPPAVTSCTDGEDNWGAVFEGFFSLRWIAAVVAEVFGDGQEGSADSSRDLMGFGGCDQLFGNDSGGDGEE